MSSRSLLSLDTFFAHEGADLSFDSNRLIVSTPAAAWTYAASCPLPRSREPVAIKVRLSVEDSPIGIGILDADGSSYIDETILSPSAAVREITLDVSHVPDGARLQIRTAEQARRAHAVITHALLEFLDDTDLLDTDRTLFAFYDVEKLPISFDFLWFLAASEVTMVMRNLSHLQVVIVRGRHAGVNAVPGEYDEVVDTVGRQWRLQNIVLPAIGLFPAVTGYTVVGTRQEALHWLNCAKHTYPERSRISSYSLGKIYKDAINGRSKVQVVGPRASDQGLRYVDTWLRRTARQPVVAMSLRQYQWLPERNNDLIALSEFARCCQSRGYEPIFVPDTDRAMEGGPPEVSEFPIFSEACWNLGLRMALYERAFTNIFPSSGVSSLCILSSQCRYLIFKLLIPGFKETDLAVFEERGIQVGRQLPFATKFQRITWRGDTVTDLTEEFDHFVATYAALGPTGRKS